MAGQEAGRSGHLVPHAVAVGDAPPRRPPTCASERARRHARTAPGRTPRPGASDAARPQDHRRPAPGRPHAVPRQHHGGRHSPTRGGRCRALAPAATWVPARRGLGCVGPARRGLACVGPALHDLALHDLIADRRRNLVRFLQHVNPGHLVDPASPQTAARQSGHHPGRDARRATADHRRCGRPIASDDRHACPTSTTAARREAAVRHSCRRAGTFWRGHAARLGHAARRRPSAPGPRRSAPAPSLRPVGAHVAHSPLPGAPVDCRYACLLEGDLRQTRRRLDQIGGSHRHLPGSPTCRHCRRELRRALVQVVRRDVPPVRARLDRRGCPASHPACPHCRNLRHPWRLAVPPARRAHDAGTGLPRARRRLRRPGALALRSQKGSSPKCTDRATRVRPRPSPAGWIRCGGCSEGDRADYLERGCSEDPVCGYVRSGCVRRSNRWPSPDWSRSR